MKKFFSLLVFLLIAVFPFAVRAEETRSPYRLSKVVVLSRHNLRTPTAGNTQILSELTPHKWMRWTAAPGNLSMKGAELETLMGQYFRQWLENEGLMEANCEPPMGEMRFYANSFQRTIATARYFASGMLPMANVRVERRLALDEADPVFLPGLPAELSDDFRAKATAELDAQGGIQGLAGRLKKETGLLSEILDFKNSAYGQEHGMTAFSTEDVEYELDTLRIGGSFRSAMRAGDALTLQYYEADASTDAAFGRALTEEEWRGIARIKDMGILALFRMPTVSGRLAQPLISEMKDELLLDGRKFTFLCGHDINLSTVLSALGAEDFKLPDTIEEKTPIGAKLVLEKRTDADGAEYASLKLVYQSAEQMRERVPLTPDAPPMVFPIRLSRLEANADGLYPFEAVVRRMDEAISAGAEK
mgnify:CR=1 FL=1